MYQMRHFGRFSVILIIFNFTRNVSSIATRRPQKMNCPVECFCGEAVQLLRPPKSLNTTAEKGRFIQENTNEEENISSMILVNILQSIANKYYVYSSEYAVICFGHNVTSIPQSAGKPIKGVSNDGNFVIPAQSSILVLRHGSISAIKSIQLQKFLRVLDLSYNQIRFIASDAMQGLRRLQVLNLQHNLLTQVEFLNEIFLHPIDAVRLSTILLEGNPIICSCDLVRIVSCTVRRDDASCLLMIEEDTKNSVDNRKSQTLIPLSYLSYISEEMMAYCVNPRYPFSEFVKIQENNFNNLLLDYSDYEERLYRPRDIGNSQTRIKKIDFPLLLTMLGWFLMVVIGLCRFIKSNTYEYEMHKDYLMKLDEQQNSELQNVTNVEVQNRASVPVSVIRCPIITVEDDDEITKADFNDGKNERAK
ncbi:uncharacterized protein LOC120336363 [Styela clava]